MTSRQKGAPNKNASNRIRLSHIGGVQVNEHRK
jgi:hypothetical protein